MPSDARSRILAAAVLCFGQAGLAKTTVMDVAREAGVSRATIYRCFPGGREQLVGETVAAEVIRFLMSLGEEVAEAPDLATRLERSLTFARRSLAEHKVFQRVLETEPERLLPHLSESGPMVLQFLHDYFVVMLRSEPLRDGVTPEEAAEWLSRMVMSYVLGSGSYDLDDPSQVRVLVRERLLAGVLAK